jgi:uncharacterized protein (TIGR04255 family)
MEQDYFSKAPIIEAIIDLRVTLPPEISLTQLSEIGDAIATRFPYRHDLVTNNFLFESGLEPSANASVQTNGLIFVHEDKQKVLEVSLSGFTFKMRSPYSRWETFQPEAQELWNLYCRICGPLNVVRVAVRYINRLDLPGTLQDFKEYLRVLPEVSDDLPQQGLSGYFMQLQVPQVDIAPDCLLILNEALVPPVVPNTIAVVLDLDLFCARPEQPWNIEDGSVWTLLEQLRIRKNQVFKASITHAMQELIR